MPVSLVTYGADPTGISDSSQAIANAIDAGVIDAYFPAGTYKWSSPCVIDSPITVRGNRFARILPPLTGFPSNRGLIEVVATSRVNLARLAIDQRGATRLNADHVRFSVLVDASSDVLIEDVRFIASGVSDGEPTGPVVQVMSKDQANDVETGIGTVGSSARVRLSRCSFVNPPGCSIAFGVRVLSDWGNLRAFSSFTHHTDDVVVESCLFSGTFAWNALQFAGGATRNGLALGCSFDVEALSCVHMDKGCRSLVVEDCRADMVGTVAYEEDATKRFAVYSAQGISDSYRCGTFVARRNQAALTSGGSDVYQCATLTQHTDSATWIDTDVTSVNDGVIGVAMFCGGNVASVTYTDTKIRGSLYGFGTDSGAGSIDSLVIDGDATDAVTRNSSVSCGGTNTAIVVRGGSYTTQDQAAGFGVIASGWTSIAISDADVVGGDSGVYVSAPTSSVKDTTIASARHYGLRVGTGTCTATRTTTTASGISGHYEDVGASLTDGGGNSWS